MTGNPEVIAALDECLKWERTVAACLWAYRGYFGRWRFHRLEHWFHCQARAACKRVEALCARIEQLDAIPGQAEYSFELVELGTADDIAKVWEYFEESLAGTRGQYEDARAACKAAQDGVSAKVCGRNQEEVEDSLCRVEAKAKKVELVGAAAYLAEHMHFQGRHEIDGDHRQQ